MEKIRNITRFLLKPLLHFKTNYSNGSEYYKYFYLPRNGSESSIDTAISKRQNITIVGNPGQGKTSLVHFLLEKYKEKEYSNHIFPIILDYRDIAPKEAKALLVKFITKMKEYFIQINRPSPITEKTTLDNCEEQLGIINEHLTNTPKTELSKKIVIFLDDLDYAEKDYMKILNEYFLTFAASDKCIVVLSVRPPLLRNIQKHSQMRQYYHIHPREILLPEGDLKTLIKNRLKSFLDERNEDKFLPFLLKVFKKPSLDDKILQILKNEGVLDKEDNKLTISLPFNDTFYTNLVDATNFNLRYIEELFPTFLFHELSEKKPSFNDDFIGAFIMLTNKKSHILLDLVTNRTININKKKNGNAKLQIILEYFYEGNIMIDDTFYSFAENYGIDKHSADWALAELESDRYSLIIPDYIYTIEPKLLDYNTYSITKKGKMYIEEILKRDEYYEIEQEKKFIRSNRSSLSNLI